MDHNIMRFDIRLAHIAPMIAAGEVNIVDLGTKVQDAIIKVISKETEWRERATVMLATDETGLLHHREIEYDFS